MSIDLEQTCTFCTMPWSSVMLRWGGRVQPCCMNSTPLGDIRENTLQEIWNGEEMQRVRKLISQSKYSEAGCHKDCAIIYKLKKEKEQQIISKEVFESTQKNHEFFINITKFQEDVQNRKEAVSAQPFDFDIQPTEFCNMACIMCHQDHNNKRYVESDFIDKLLKDFEKVFFVRFQGGEVFVDKEFLPYLSELKNKLLSHQKIQVITNASLLSKHDLEELSDGNGLLQFIVSMDSLKENIYRHIRQSTSFEKVRENLIHLSQIQQKNKKNDLVIWNFMITKSNFYEIIDAIEFALEYKIKVNFYSIIGEYKEENIFIYKDLREKDYEKYINEAIEISKKDSLGLINGLEKIKEQLGY